MKPTTIASVTNVIEHYSINLNSDYFKTTVNEIIKKYEIDEIVETGTFNGLGSTQIFAQTGKYVYTIECNYNNYVQASQNLRQYPNVCVIHGFSLNVNETIKWLLAQEFTKEAKADTDFPKAFYMREISHLVPVQEALQLFTDNERKQLVFLDSAGGIGYFEFLKFMSFNPKNKILMLDDIDHIKHHNSVKYLKENGYKINISEDNRFAWTDLKK